MKFIIYIFLFTGFFQTAFSQQVVLTGKVIGKEKGEAISGATIKLKGSGKTVFSKKDGTFSIIVPGNNNTLSVSHTGYQNRLVTQESSGNPLLLVALELAVNDLKEVIVSTGYQQLSKERATGSFTVLDANLLNRNVSTDILSKLEGITNGLDFDRRIISSTTLSSPPTLKIRGLSTLYADNNPLIVVDNFPYEGDINSINPNDVIQVTVLKDAAAASIWGARAGNGVIVITTRNGHYNQPLQINLNSNITIGAKPDLFKSPNFLSSADYIGVEQQLFAREFYKAEEDNLNKSPLSPVVELLIKQRDKKITDDEFNKTLSGLAQQDVRNDLTQYFYRGKVNQQYALNINGGSATNRYSFSSGYDKNLTDIIGNDFQRITLRTTNTYRPVKKLELTTGISYIQNRTADNGLGITDINPLGKGIYSYADLVDEQGNALPIPKDYRISYAEAPPQAGLLDWLYRPYAELAYNNNKISRNETRIDAGIKYEFNTAFNASLNYQYNNITNIQRALQGPENYVTRNLINQFTQADGNRAIAYGSVLNQAEDVKETHAIRGQLNYHKIFNTNHEITAIAGYEIRQTNTQTNGFRFYGYDEDIITHQIMIDYSKLYPRLPRSSSRIPESNAPINDLTDRFVSYYANAGYNYKERYLLSVSARKDASNLFGVKTNQKGVPLWSAGAAWLIDKESFFNVSWINLLKLRTTFGYSGNVDNSVTAYTTASYSTDNLTGLKKARIITPPNPELRWERVSNLNLGVDFSLLNNRISGSVEYYDKKGKDLLGVIPLDPTSGFLENYKINYADINTHGIDAELRIKNIDQQFKWQTDLLFSYVTDKVIDYKSDPNIASLPMGFNTPIEGKHRFMIYSYPWLGLDPQTGDPLVSLNGVPSKNYSEYQRTRRLEDMIYHGRATPPVFGSVRNTISYRNITLSANIVYKLGYYFRRSSIDYDIMFNNWRGHKDYKNRWQKSGDELVTNVPSMPVGATGYRDIIYSNSPELVEKGDYIRLQDINFSYRLEKNKLKNLPFKSVVLYLYARDLGIIWAANKQGLDPEYHHANYPPVKTIAAGIKVDF